MKTLIKTASVFLFVIFSLLLGACSGPLPEKKPSLSIHLGAESARFSYLPSGAEASQMEVKVVLTSGNVSTSYQTGGAGTVNVYGIKPGDYDLELFCT